MVPAEDRVERWRFPEGGSTLSVPALFVASESPHFCVFAGRFFVDEEGTRPDGFSTAIFINSIVSISAVFSDRAFGAINDEEDEIESLSLPLDERRSTLPKSIVELLSETRRRNDSISSCAARTSLSLAFMSSISCRFSRSRNAILLSFSMWDALTFLASATWAFSFEISRLEMSNCSCRRSSFWTYTSTCRRRDSFSSSKISARLLLGCPSSDVNRSQR
mmetsp:Transcript_59858/g.147043  ORF Transcript_59858/g.147043 Transcript_59858/m.147043 type:complete len:220 (+) Transcript_59858:354-1013(+)